MLTATESNDSSQKATRRGSDSSESAVIGSTYNCYDKMSMGKRKKYALSGALACILFVVAIIVAVAILTTNNNESSSQAIHNNNENNKNRGNDKNNKDTLVNETIVSPSPNATSTTNNNDTKVIAPSDQPTASVTLTTTAPTSLRATTNNTTPTPSPIKTNSTSGLVPTINTTTIATVYPSAEPTIEPTTLEPTVTITTDEPSSPTTERPTTEILTTGETIFYAIGDVPYSDEQAVKLNASLTALPDDAEFMIHVGDIRNSGASLKCIPSDYEDASKLFQLSPVPVFILIGDNDWTDCPNPKEGRELWDKHFIAFDSKYWDHDFNVKRLKGREENFAFLHKGTLYIGLNIIGTPVHNQTEWTTRLTEELEWTKLLIKKYINETLPADITGRIVIFGHANPNSGHNDFFQPFRRFIRDELENKVPILYINGDKHEWLYEPTFYNQESFLRIMVSGKAQDPPLKVTVNANGKTLTPEKAFVHDRRLDAI